MREVDKVIEHRVNLMRAAYLSVLEQQGWSKKRLQRLDEDVGERVGKLMDRIREQAIEEGADVSAILAPAADESASWLHRAWNWVRDKLRRTEDDDQV